MLNTGYGFTISPAEDMKRHKQQIVAALQILSLMAEVICTAGEIPSGTLYAIVADKMSLSACRSAIAQLEGAGLVRQSNHLLMWVGPRID